MTEARRHVVCCPDKFRGSLDAPAAAAALAAGVEDAGLPSLVHPLADGGEGTLDTIRGATGGQISSLVVPDARGHERSARIGILPDGTGLVEMAQAVGLASLAPDERDVMHASTAGVGRMIRRALALCPRRVVVALGGSGTMDGGLGAIRELGARLLDASGTELRGSGVDLMRLERIDATGLDVGPSGVLEIVVDAWCPIHGPGGAAEVFGPQKGADAADVRKLDGGLARLAELLGLGSADRARLGTGGAFAAPFAALAGARVSSGAEYVRVATGFDEALAGARLCITGEGRVDTQSGLGKTTLGVVHAASGHSIPTIVVGGAVDDEAACLYDEGAAAIFSIGRQPGTCADAKVSAAANLRWIGRAVGGFVSAMDRNPDRVDRRDDASRTASTEWFVESSRNRRSRSVVRGEPLHPGVQSPASEAPNFGSDD